MSDTFKDVSGTFEETIPGIIIDLFVAHGGRVCDGVAMESDVHFTCADTMTSERGKDSCAARTSPLWILDSIRAHSLLDVRAYGFTTAGTTHARRRDGTIPVHALPCNTGLRVLAVVVRGAADQGVNSEDL